MNNYNPKQYWEERGKNYSVSVDTSAELRNLARLRLLHGWYSDKVLEVGSGYGRIFQYLTSQKLVEAGIYSMCDISTSMMDECYKRTGIMPLLYDGTTLPYEDNSFDWIISFSVFLHVPPEDFFEFFKEHVRVCKKYFYIATLTHEGRLADHCFRHDYFEIIKTLGLKIVNQKPYMDGMRTNWLLKKTG